MKGQLKRGINKHVKPQKLNINKKLEAVLVNSFTAVHQGEADVSAET